ncbi:MAG: FG-GAP repeat protein [Fibrobacteria bacterium]|nr:FG-GAP repeat protein [Fibrobacteria bacterium]
MGTIEKMANRCRRWAMQSVAFSVALYMGAGAEIPGVFVVQESRIEDPVTTSARPGKRFGVSGMDWAGDIDGDGVPDLVVGAGESFGDSGSLQFVLLDRSGKAKGAPIAISTRDPLIGPLLSKYGAFDNFGGGVGVVRKFSVSEDCAVIAAASTNKAKLWALRICRDGQGLAVDDVSVIDSTTSPILQGFGTLRIGEQLRNIDTLATGEVVLSATAPTALVPGTRTVLGGVLLVALNPNTLAWRKVGRIPESYDATDPVMSQLVGSASGFGRSVVRLTSPDGLRLGIVSWGDKPQARVHVVDLDDQYLPTSDRPVLPSAGAETVLGAYSASAADFDHDGVLDLVVGLPQRVGRNAVAGVGGFSVILLSADGSAKDARQYGPTDDGGGFVDSGDVLVEKSYLGWDVLAGDLDGDDQPEVMLGAYGTASSPASIWWARMKTLPWVRHLPDTIRLDTDPQSWELGMFLGGHALSWRVEEVRRSTVDAAVRCAEVSGRLRCVPLGTNGSSTWRVVATDSGNVPSTDRFSDSLELEVVVSGGNIPPERSQTPLVARVTLQEDQKDSVVAVLSRHFVDPDGRALTFRLTPLGGSTAALINYYLSSDSLHVRTIPLRHGLCSLQVVAEDDYRTAAFDTLVIEVVHVNHPPTARDDAYTLLESTPTPFPVTGNDEDLDAQDILTVSVAIPPSHGKAAIVSGGILFTPDSFFVGRDSLRYLLTDGHVSDSAWARFEVFANTDRMRIYKPLRDTTVQEDADTVVIRTDSLFFSGAGRFYGGSGVVIHDCREIAEVVRDWYASTLKLLPKPHQWGRCGVVVRGFELVSSDGGATHTTVIHDDTLLLTIQAELTPYRLPKDTIWLEMVKGTPSTIVLDTVDLDRDTLEYEVLGSLPDWMSLGAFSLHIVPGQEEAKVSIAVRKKALQGVTFLENTDTLVVYARFATVSSQGRALGTMGFRLRQIRNALILDGGRAPTRVDLLDFDGRVLRTVLVPAHGRTTVSTTGLRRIVLLRLEESGNPSIHPLILQP